MPNLTIPELTNQIGQWSQRNFGDKQASELGIVEEIGELCHVLLKQLQGIRGFHDPAVAHAAILDAHADIGVFCLNFSWHHNIMIADLVLTKTEGWDDYRYLEQILRTASLLVCYSHRDFDHDLCVLDELGQTLQQVWNWNMVWADYHGIHLRTAVEETWKKVQKREWAQNKMHAHIVAEEGGTQVPTSVKL